MKLVIASSNPHKVREYREMFSSHKGLDILSLMDFADYEPPEENGSSFEENALIKAEDAYQKLDSWVIADDTGLVVPSLNGAPGIFSARYAGKNASDSENRKKLLHNMTETPEEERHAYFECCIALVGPKDYKKTLRGRCEGMILTEERGGNGFGYDPLFVKTGYTKSFAELDEATKNRVSHRRKALDKLLIVLESVAS